MKNIKAAYESKFINVYDMEYAEGKHYLTATRRIKEDLIASKTDKEFSQLMPDAVSCIVVLNLPNSKPRLLLAYEYRYPTGQYLLSVPAGLIDDKNDDPINAIMHTAMRELKEETGIDIKASDSVRMNVVNRCVFSSPGMTDESNALVCIVLDDVDISILSQKDCNGTELFGGFCLLTEEDARNILKEGRDNRGRFYPIYTWSALMYFVSDMWR